MKPSAASQGKVIRSDTIRNRIASRAMARSDSAPAIRRRRDMRSANRPAGIANSTKGRVSAVCNSPVAPSPTPSSSTATIGAAASAICSADCAARLDQARRLKVGGRRGISRAGMEDSLMALPDIIGLMAGPSHPLSDKRGLMASSGYRKVSAPLCAETGSARDCELVRGNHCIGCSSKSGSAAALVVTRVHQAPDEPVQPNAQAVARRAHWSGW